MQRKDLLKFPSSLQVNVDDHPAITDQLFIHALLSPLQLWILMKGHADLITCFQRKTIICFKRKAKLAGDKEQKADICAFVNQRL